MPTVRMTSAAVTTGLAMRTRPRRLRAVVARLEAGPAVALRVERCPGRSGRRQGRCCCWRAEPYEPRRMPAERWCPFLESLDDVGRKRDAYLRAKGR